MRKSTPFAVLAVAGVLAMMGTLRGADTGPKPVKIDTGSISGATDANGVMAYKGIPYAAPPVGDLRFKPPQPTAHWDGVRKGEQFGSNCMQQDMRSFLPWTEEFMTQGNLSEDCLTLNVWTGAKAATEKRAVMVWFYGGGFGSGAGSITVYDGAALAKKGVVVVSVNYRVGALGFLVHPELTKESPHHSSGNYGLLDQIAALQWVQRNIGAFGGDPKKVTIFGQSAGALAVQDLMNSSLASGLFVRAIAESGPGLIAGNARAGGAMSFADREQAGQKYAEALGAHSLADLRKLPAADFFKAPAGGGRGGYAPGGPVVDGWVLTGQTPKAASQVPLVVGMVADDVGVGAAGPKPTVASYQEAARTKYGASADEFLKLYPVSTDDDIRAMMKTAGRDQARVSIDLWAANQTKASQTVYTYYFDRAIPWPAHPEFGAFHTSDVPYIFQTIHKIDRPWTPVDDHVSEVVSSYWVNFASSGEPGGKNLPEWPVYSAGDHKTMELGEKMGPMPVADAARLKFQMAYLMKANGN